MEIESNLLIDKSDNEGIINTNLKSFRKPTNIICIFIWAGLLFLIIPYSIGMNSDIKNLNINQVYDSKGNACGIGELKDYSKLYFTNFQYPYKSVCVEKCVKIDYNKVKYNYLDNKENANKSKPMYFSSFNNYLKKNNKKILPDIGDIKNPIYEPIWFNYFTEEQWENYSKNYEVKCYVNEDVKSCSYKYDSSFIIYDSRSEYNPICVPLNNRIKELINEVIDIFNLNMIFGIIYNYKLFLYASIISFVLSIYFLILIKFFSKFFIWMLIISANMLFLIIGIFLQLAINKRGVFLKMIKNQNYYLSYFILHHQNQFIILSFVLIITGILILIFTILKKNKLNILFEITTKASDIVLKNLSNVFLCIVSIILKFCLIYYLIIFSYKIIINDQIYQKINYQDGIPFISYDIDFYKILELSKVFLIFIIFYRLLDNLVNFNQISIVINDYYHHHRNGFINFFYIIITHIGTIVYHDLLFLVNFGQLILKFITFDLVSNNIYFMNINEVPFGVVYLTGKSYFDSIDIYVYLLKKFGDIYSVVFTFSNIIYYLIIIIVSLISAKINILIIISSNMVRINNFDINYIIIISLIISFFIVYSLINCFYYSIMGVIICLLVDENNLNILDIDFKNKHLISKMYNEFNVNRKMDKKYEKLSN